MIVRSIARRRFVEKYFYPHPACTIRHILCFSMFSAKEESATQSTDSQLTISTNDKQKQVSNVSYLVF